MKKQRPFDFDKWGYEIKATDYLISRWKITVSQGVMSLYPSMYAFTLKSAQRKGDRAVAARVRADQRRVARQARADALTH